MFGLGKVIEPDVHPIVQCPAESLERRVQLLEIALGYLWDEVWWHQLPFYRRWFYMLQGFKSPIRRFYVPLEGIDRASS